MNKSAEVYFLGHSGFGIVIDDIALIFDYYIDPKDVLPCVLKNVHKKIFFSSHVHHDHFNKKVLEYNDLNTYYVFSDDIKISSDKSQNITFIGQDEKKNIDEIEISTIGSTDQGVAFIVKVNEWSIFHAGDLNWWHWNGDTDENLNLAEVCFKKELSKIEGMFFDIAFFPVDARLEEHSTKGVNEFLNFVQVENIVPMHMHGFKWNDKKIKNKNGESKIWFPMESGFKNIFIK